jgi:hypothetical protein
VKPTWQESADLKQALKHDPETPELAAEAQAFPLEADEAVIEVEQGLATCSPGSWVANRIAEGS